MIEDNNSSKKLGKKMLKKSKKITKINKNLNENSQKMAKNDKKLKKNSQKMAKNCDLSTKNIETDVKNKNDDEFFNKKNKNSKNSNHNLRKVIPLYFKRKKNVSVFIIFLIIYGISNLLTPIFTANTIAYIANNNLTMATKSALFVGLFGILSIIFGMINEYFYIKINHLISYDLTLTLIDSISSTKMSTLDSVKLGSLAERLSRDVNIISDSFLDMLNLIINIITNFVFFIYIAFLNIYMFLILAVYVVLYYIICVIRTKIYIRGRKVTRKANDEATSAYYEQIMGIRDVKLLNLKENVTNYSNTKNKKALNLSMKVAKKRIFIKYFARFFSIIFELIFIIVGIVLVSKELLLLSGLLVVYTYYGRVENLVSFISQFKEFSSEGEISAGRVYDIIENYEKESFGQEQLEDFSGYVDFNNVTFGYGQKPVIENLSLSFNPNEMTAIVGKSGSGKTTILNLISKLYDCSDGEILLDGKNINNLSEQAIRSAVGEVSQAPYIFNATIRQNLLFAKPDATDDEIYEALKKAQIYDDVMTMEKQLDSEIGENGIKLSGGQKQRLAIARLFLKNNKVLVFDEATSALDNERQNKIVEILQSQKQDKTIIIVAHRLSTIIGADKIYMIEKGKVIACGSHKKLMKTCKSYSDLYKLEEKNAIIEND